MGKSKIYCNPRLKEFARAHRNNGTKAEACLWKYILRVGGLNGYNFRRQRPIGNYIADFLCFKLKLVIEVDGITHSWEEVTLKDEKKNKDLKEMGFRVVRFTDDEVLTDVEGVRRKLVEIVEGMDSHYPPLRGINKTLIQS